MGRFTCASCQCVYYDKRFAWESDVDDVVIQEEGGEGEEDVDKFGVETDSTASTEEKLDRSEVPSRRPSIQSQETSSRRPSIGSDPNSVIDQYRTQADIMRGSGTIANLTGMVAPAAHVALGCVSAVGGVVGASAGLAQLNQGLNTPSGKKDPHLIAKGSVTTSVGATCMVIGACATAVPPLFFVAAGLGAAGLGTAIALDANVDGLCLECRNNKADEEDTEEPHKEWWEFLPWVNKEDERAMEELRKKEAEYLYLASVAEAVTKVLEGHSEWEIRQEAAWFLGEFRIRKQREELEPVLERALCQDAHFSVRRAAANTLGRWRLGADVLASEQDNLKEQEEIIKLLDQSSDNDWMLREIQHLQLEVSHALQRCQNHTIPKMKRRPSIQKEPERSQEEKQVPMVETNEKLIGA